MGENLTTDDIVDLSNEVVGLEKKLTCVRLRVPLLLLLLAVNVLLTQGQEGGS